MGPDFFWNADQERAEKRIFLYRKWFYDKERITAYGVNMRLFSRLICKSLRAPKGDRA